MLELFLVSLIYWLGGVVVRALDSRWAGREFDSHAAAVELYLVTFAFTITKHKTFTYIFAPIAQLKRLCKFFPLLWGGGAGRDFVQ